MKGSLFWFVCGTLGLLSASLSAQVSSFTIPNGDVPALKNAIIASNTDSREDIINLAQNGTYTLTTVDNSADGPNGLPVIAQDGGHLITINGNGATLQRSAAGGTPVFRLIQAGTNGSLVVNNLTFKNGSALGLSGGGAIYNFLSIVVLTSCTFNGNNASGSAGANGVSGHPSGSDGNPGQGGAIYSIGALICNSCTFTSNSASGGKGGNNFSGGSNGGGGMGLGGAIYQTFGNLFLTDCTFVNDSSAGGDPGNGSGGGTAPYGESLGGAVYVSSISSSVLSIVRNTFNTNNSLGGGNSLVNASLRRAGFGGAVCLDFFGSGSIEDSTFTNNMAHNGGALCALDSLFTVTGSTFTGNSAQFVSGLPGNTGRGGVAYGMGDSSFPGGGTLADCTLYSNSAALGGAVASDGTIALTNCTLSANTASSDGGSIYGAVELTNTILKGGTPSNLGSAAGHVSHGHNISDDAAGGGAGTGLGGYLNGTGDMRNTNPQLASASPQNNGGLTNTFALNAASPAINQGDDSAAPYRDQRGNFRTGVVDIGAFEYNGGFVGATDIQRDGNDAVISAEVAYGYTYRLERKANITDPSWQNLSATVDDIQASGNDIESITDPNGFTLPRAFYHITVVP